MEVYGRRYGVLTIATGTWFGRGRLQEASVFECGTSLALKVDTIFGRIKQLSTGANTTPLGDRVNNVANPDARSVPPIYITVSKNTRHKKEARPNRDQTSLVDIRGHVIYTTTNFQNLSGRHKFLTVIHSLQMKLPRCPSIFTREIWAVVPHHLHS